MVRSIIRSRVSVSPQTGYEPNVLEGETKRSHLSVTCNYLYSGSRRALIERRYISSDGYYILNHL